MIKMYVFQEYPKCLYQGDDTITVDNAEEEAGAVALGWKTAADHFGYDAGKVVAVEQVDESQDSGIKSEDE